MPSKKKYNARFPPARIKKIMQTDEDVGKVAAAVPVLISKALEIFLESLITKSSQQTQSRSAKTMTTAHIKQCIQGESTFDFLKDLVDNVPDISQGDEEESENHHASSAASNNNNRHTESFSRSSSTASSSSVTDHAPPKRRRGRPRKNPEDRAGPSHRRKRSQVVAQSSEDRTTSEDSDLSETDMVTEDRKPHTIPTIMVSQTDEELKPAPSPMTWPMQQQHHHHQHQQLSHHQQQPSHGIPQMPQFHLPTAPSHNPPNSAAMMGLYQMPKTTSNICVKDDDDEDDYDT